MSIFDSKIRPWLAFAEQRPFAEYMHLGFSDGSERTLPVTVTHFSARNARLLVRLSVYLTEGRIARVGLGGEDFVALVWNTELEINEPTEVCVVIDLPLSEGIACKDSVLTRALVGLGSFSSGGLSVIEDGSYLILGGGYDAELACFTPPTETRTLSITNGFCNLSAQPVGVDYVPRHFQ